MLNQPDAVKFVRQCKEIADRSHRVDALARKQLLDAQVALQEFESAGQFSQQTCERMNDRNLKIQRKLDDLATRNAIVRGYAWFLLPEGAGEGDSPLCEC